MRRPKLLAENSELFLFFKPLTSIGHVSQVERRPVVCELTSVVDPPKAPRVDQSKYGNILPVTSSACNLKAI